ncbi:MAG: NfeD family protein [Polyangiaceae bacterium]
MGAKPYRLSASMHLLEVLFSFPTIAFTAPLALCLVYWIFVLVGALDLDSGGGHADGVEGHADGALDHADVGHGHGDVADGHGHDGGDADGDGGDAADADTDGFFATMMSALKLRKVPLTVRLSLLSFFGWLASGLTSLSIDAPSWPVRIGVFLGAFVVSVLLTSLAIRPLVPVFDTKEAGNKDVDLVGKIAVVSTGSVTETFGQATFDDGGAGLTLQVRAHVPNLIRKGTRCVIVDHDAAKGTFSIEPLPEDDLRPRIDALAEGSSSLSTAESAEDQSSTGEASIARTKS